MESFQSNFPENEHHFFKMIRSGNTFLCTKLMIPTEFTRKYGRSLPDRVYLETPSGAIFPVDLERTENQLWLHKGWPEFAKFHSLCQGHLLVFQYQENSNKFVVLIFDETASEVEYPSFTSGGPSQKTKPAFREAMHYGESSNMKLKTKLNDTHASKQQEKEDNNPRFLADVEKAIAMAKAFRSKNPNIMIVIRPSYANNRSLPIKRKFVEEYITSSRDQVILQVGGKSWVVTCILYLSTACFTGGWNIFARDNDVSEGDVCVFELLNRREMLINPQQKLINVVIFRGT